MQLLDIREPGETPLPHALEEVAVGIDLGTTNSLVAISTAERSEIIRDPQGRSLVPSIVAYGEDRKVIVGEEARRCLLDDPDNVVSSVKRLMGRGSGAVQSVAGTLPYEIVEHEDGGMVRLRVGGRVLSPVEVSAEILRVLKDRAEHSLGKSVTKAVVTVPAYFDDAARHATKDAARLAGIEVLRLVNEPTSAALAYGLDSGAEGHYAIYDLGGGTFDISILRLEKGIFQVLATGGDAALGGDDFDHVIADYFFADSERAPSSGEVKQALVTARLAKECLTTQDSGVWQLEAGGEVSRHTLDVETLERLILPLVERTMKTCRQVLHDAELEPGDIAGVVLVGGSTRVPLVCRMVAALFDREPLSDINPEEVVALGAALQAEALTRGASTLLLDVTPLSLGIETMGGLVEKVIPRNTAIPVARAQEFTTYQDGQTAMSIHVLQGEREMSDQNRSLARFELNGIPPLTAGAARIKVTFAVDADGLLTVSALEQTTGTEQRVEVKPSYGLSDQEMARMLRESMENAQADMNRRLLAEARVEADRVLLALRGALTKDSALLSPSELKSLEEGAAALAEKVAGDDRQSITEAMEALDAASRDFAARRMDRGIRNALEGVGIKELADTLEAGG